MDKRTSILPVRFEPFGASVSVPLGAWLTEAALQAGIELQMPCGGEGLCGKCRVRVLEGHCPPTPLEQRRFSPEELQAGWRLACQTAVEEPLVVEVPEKTLAQAAAKILVAGQVLADFQIDPPVKKRFVIVPPPTRQDDAADFDRLLRALAQAELDSPARESPRPHLSSPPPSPSSASENLLSAHQRPLRADWTLLRQLPDRLRQTQFQGTAVLAENCLLDFEPADTTSAHYAVAVDVGTTTLAACLIHVPTGRELAVAAETNPQTAFGDDVITRISYAQGGPHHLEELRGAVIAAIDRLVGQLAEQAHIPRNQIYYLTLVGNPTMQHLACGITPRYLGEVPFTPAVGGSLVGEAKGLGVRIHPSGLVYVAPVIGGYVGGDIVAGIVAAGLAHQDRPTLFLDIGTNGEMVLSAGGRLYAAATAAGPAFEGARITYGMRAALGAIEKVRFDGQWHLGTIGNQPPRGICGSALIDLAAELLRLGVIRPDGRLSRPEQSSEVLPAPGSRSTSEQPSQVSLALRDRCIEQNGEPAFVVCPADQTATGEAILLTQRDIRQLQLATGAIRAGLQLLLHQAGLRPLDLERIFLAGGFGNYIRRRNAQRIGLLPEEVPAERIQFLGNTALAGARLFALSKQAQKEAQRLARRAEHIDLAALPDFAATFAQAMIFPENNPGKRTS